MVREVHALISSTCSIDIIAIKHAANDGIQAEEFPNKDGVTHKHHSSITDDESGFSETETETISVPSSPVPLLNEDDYELASVLSDDMKKEFCSDMGFIFHAEFQLTFGRYFLSDRWVLMPLGIDGIFRLPSDSLCDVEIAKVRFECDSCSHCWTSMRGQISFFYDCKSYILYFKLFAQLCDRCSVTCTPLWYPEEVCRVMRNVFVDVNQRVYPNLKTPIQSNHHRRFGNPKGQHHGCESCRDGVCVAVAEQQLGCKLIK
ncbi:unnamed protein product [Rotaria socialis]|uniref:3CxxC-type domain-containing protein n=1 Tax=Rotaria socialis TaxID=392032 RepID=A0A817X804_9BILA|nr:unnamed protein product [Rotaria socialis]CAF3363810.1 unnamed protein product [Rotaria socialis]CAF4118121.1 unnamed protein product [Rotaria socialis]CAF4179408.1 unnamed protein product [Rotaria socialis]